MIDALGLNHIRKVGGKVIKPMAFGRASGLVPKCSEVLLLSGELLLFVLFGVLSLVPTGAEITVNLQLSKIFQSGKVIFL